MHIQFMNAKIVKILTITGLAGSLVGCVSPDGSPDRTGTGALVGGASGAAIGAMADRRNPGAGALIGAAAGTIFGGLVGHSADQQAAAARDRERPTTVYVAPPPTAPPTSLADIKSMASARVSDDVIISQINSTHAVYHLDANAIVDLSNAGVSQKVIAYMINTSGDVTVSQAPPPPRVESYTVVAPGPDYVWVDCEWAWMGGSWIWVNGRWDHPPRGRAVWVSARWEHGPRGYYRVGGYWR